MNERLIRAVRMEEVDCTPVWFMRQAGRSLPRYREVRADRGMFDVLRDAPAAARVTALPLEYYDVDAAVLYNDISTPFLAAGLDVELRSGVGPVVNDPVIDPADVDRLEPFDPRTALRFNLEQIRILKDRLEVPILGFIGAPFTLCSYQVGESRSRDLRELKSFIFSAPQAWDRLATYWVEHLSAYAIAQFEAGAAAVQLFDSWAGTLSPDDYRSYILPYNRGIFERLAGAGVPSIHFSIGNPALLPLVASAGGDVVSVDWRIPLDEAWSIIGADRAIQGNLDPVALLAGESFALERTRAVLDRVRGRPGHIFNLGHGMLPSTDPAVAKAVVDYVHEYTAE